ncbi:MAG: hypothetical protein U1E65_16990 [Myxococcota bacterium]
MLSALFAVLITAPPAPWLLVVPTPARTVPELAPFLDWVALPLPELSSDRARRRGQAVFGIDPLSLGTFQALGADPKRPLLLWFDPDRDFTITEIALSDPAKARALVAAIAKKVPRARAMEGGFLAGETLNAMIGALVREDRLWLVLGGTYTPPLDPKPLPSDLKTELGKDAVGAPLLAATKEKRPSLPKSLSSTRAPDLYGTLLMEGAVERMDFAIELGARAFKLRSELEFGPKSGLALNEGLVAKRRPNTALVQGATTAIDLRLALSGTGLGSVLDHAGLPSAAAKSMTGAVEVLLTPEGALVALAELGPRPDRAALSGLEQALTAHFPGAATRRVEKNKRSIFAAWVGAFDPKLLDQLGDRASAAAPVELIAAPTRLFSALKARSGTPDRLGPRSMDLMMLRFVLRPWFDGTTALRGRLSLPAGRPRVEAEVSIKAPGAP